MPIVHYKNSNEEVEVLDGVLLKDVIFENGWSVPFGCESGVCGTCVVKINKGAENLSEVSENEKNTLLAMGLNKNAFRLACQSRVCGDIEFETF